MTSFSLKVLACFFMLIDHIGFALLPEAIVLRIIGRLAFPIFAFQVSVGFKKTSNKEKYIFRMLLFALISQIPFLLLRSVSGYSSFSLNIGFTFLIALLTLYSIDYAMRENTLLPFLPALILLAISFAIPMDYGFYGILVVIIFYFFDGKKSFIPLTIFSLLATCIYVYVLSNSAIQFYMLFALPILYFFNGLKGKNVKYLFYIFYPLHLLLLYFIKILI